MKEKEINLNKTMIQDASGILLDEKTMVEKKKNIVYENYTKRFNERLNVPTPNIRIPWSGILTKACIPEMQGYTESGLIINKIINDDITLNRLERMTHNVSNEQEILVVGEMNRDKFKAGERVKIDFSRYRTIHDGHTPGVIETMYDIPVMKIKGNEYLYIDARDIMYVLEEEVKE